MDQAYAYAAEQVRQLDRDRFLAGLFAPAAARPHLYALAAFAAEIGRIRDLVSDPLPGEVRAQWWRDMIDGRCADDAASHPIAAALIDTIRRFNLPVEALLRLIEAHSFDLYDDPMASVNEFEGYAGDTASALIQLSAIILAGGRDPGTAEIAGHAGVAVAIAWALRGFARHASRGQIFVPMELLAAHGVDRDAVLSGRPSPGLAAALASFRALARQHLARTRALIGAVPTAVAPALLIVALVEPSLALSARAGDPYRGPVELPQWRRQWILWRAAAKAGRGGAHRAAEPAPSASR